MPFRLLVILIALCGAAPAQDKDLRTKEQRLYEIQ